MSQAARDVAGLVGDLRSRCDLLLRHLGDIDGQFTGYELFDDDAETDLIGAVTGWGGAAIHSLDNSIASVDEVLREIFRVLERKKRR